MRDVLLGAYLSTWGESSKGNSPIYVLGSNDGVNGHKEDVPFFRVRGRGPLQDYDLAQETRGLVFLQAFQDETAS